MTILSINQLTFWYRLAEPPIVYNCEFSVREKEFVAIVGESGSGKSTLLRLCCGLIQNQIKEHPENGYHLKGDVKFDGVMIKKPHARFAYVPQNFQSGLLPGLKAIDNIYLAVRSAGLSDQEKMLAHKLMDVSGIHDVSHLYVRQLSGGQQQRVAICRALITEPKVLFMDEPFANLDPSLKPEMNSLLKNLREEYSLSVLVVTHDIEGAISLADSILGVKPGFSRPEYKLWENHLERNEIEKWIEI